MTWSAGATPGGLASADVEAVAAMCSDFYSDQGEALDVQCSSIAEGGGAGTRLVEHYIRRVDA